MYEQGNDPTDFTKLKPPISLVKTISYLVLPGYASIYFLLSFVWDFPAVKNVLGVFALISFSLGLYLEFKANHYDGQIVVMNDPDGKKTFMLEIAQDPNQLEVMKTVLFKVTNERSPGYEDPNN